MTVKELELLVQALTERLTRLETKFNIEVGGVPQALWADIPAADAGGEDPAESVTLDEQADIDSGAADAETQTTA